jgi:hypothetical protein
MQLTEQKCKRHSLREAAARCLQCGWFFCRECVTEHEDRVVCSDCLASLTAGAGPKAPGLKWLLRAAGGCAGFFVAWLFFFGLGRMLLSLPTVFHEGTYWTETIWDEETK